MSDKAYKNIHEIIRELDYLLSKNEYSLAAEFLENRIKAAEKTNDYKTLFSLYNECIGLFRKLQEKEKCFYYCEKALSSAEASELSLTVAGATAFINCATAYKAFGDAEKSLPLFIRAREIYEKLLPESDKRLAGLYNNFALTLVDLRRFDEAWELYEKALSVLEKAKNGLPEEAITFLNMANALEAKSGIEEACEKINELLDKAQKLLDESISETDGNYAFVCEKCASTFGYYGRFFYEAELKERARVIYERT